MRSLWFSIPICAILGSTAGAQSSGPVSLTILHTNDMHAQYLAREATWLEATPRPLIGGFVRLSEVIDSLRKVHQWTLTLDAGDVMTGNPIADLAYDGVQGGLLIEMMNQLAYDAWSPGNHEFDISQSNLRGLLLAADFPSLAANLADSTGAQYDGTIPYTVLKRGELRIGVVGLMSQRLSSLVLQRNLVGVRVLDPAATLQRWIDELDPQTDLLVALTHQGYEEDSSLAEQVSGLDIIVGGHSHTRLRAPRVVNGVVIVQAGSYCENLGVLSVTVSDDAVVAFDGGMIPLWVRESPSMNPLVPLVDSVRSVVEREYAEVITTLREAWPRRDSRQRLAIAVTEAQRQAAQAEVAFMNRGGIRRDLADGPVTRNDLYEVLPFRNVLGTFQLSGRQLREVVSYVIDTSTDVILSGLTVDFSKRSGKPVELESIMVGGMPLEDERSYRCAASDYFLSQFERYCGLAAPPAAYSAVTVLEAVEQSFRQKSFQEQLPSPAMNERQPMK